MIATPPAVDPITLEVIRNGLVSITNQIDANITRTAFSPYIYEYRDYAVGFVGVDGELIAQSVGGMPIFVADSVGAGVRDGLALYGAEGIYQGDVIVCNHAAVQGQHLNNTVMYTPVDAAGVRVGYFAVNVHWMDIGGGAVGSISKDSTDIFMEGLQLRSIRLWSKGERVEDVYRIIENNTRFPTELMGDIEAQLAGCLQGRDLMAALARKYGTATFQTAIGTILDQCEAAARAKVLAIPDGTYEAESALDDDGIGTEPIPIKVRVIVAGDEMTVDYSDMPPQVRSSINSGAHGGGLTTARIAFKYLIATSEPANAGTFRPLKLILPPGTLVSASPRAAMGNYGFPFPTIVDTFIKALEKAMPEAVTGAHFGSYSSVRLIGTFADGTPFQCYDSGHGGWGASAHADGSGPFRTMAHGDSRIIPVELQESMYPYRLEAFTLREDSAGAGKHRGGLGFRKRYRILGNCRLSLNFERHVCPPWGVHGGGAGEPGIVRVYKGGAGEPEIVYKSEHYQLAPGDIVVVETGGGGGYGSPHSRERAAIERDLVYGYITPEAAQSDYGLSDADISDLLNTSTAGAHA
jgi:N-methylhydantoinase B